MRLDETPDPSRSSWVEGADGHADFPIQNLPYRVFPSRDGDRRAGVAIGERILDLRAVAAMGLLPPAGAEVLGAATLNRLMALPAAHRTDLRRRLSALLSETVHRKDLAPLLFS